MKGSMLLAVVLVVVSCSLSVALRPIVLVHGLFASNNTWINTKKYILCDFPDANITEVTLFDGIDSLTNMWTQVEGVYNEIQPVLDWAPDGVTLICYSQGGLVCRGIIQTYSNHNVHTFISISAPLMGQFGITALLSNFIPSEDRRDVYKFAYDDFLQEELSIANYWNDPFHQYLYLKYCTFLPVLNNVTNKPVSFQGVNQLVLIGGPDDGVITPWQSSQFGFYPANNDTTVLPMESQEVYRSDVFGLQTLNKAGNVSLCEMAGVQHSEWVNRPSVFSICIKSWLK